MSNIDISMRVTAQEHAALRAEENAQKLKSECQARVFAVADQLAQTNMAAAAVTGRLNAQDVIAYDGFLEWVSAMRAVCRIEEQISSDPDIWPLLPAAAQALRTTLSGAGPVLNRARRPARMIL